jgi:uncharacterized membrane protein YhiD involved in acid resistance
MSRSNLLVLLIAAVAGASLLGLFLSRPSPPPPATANVNSNISAPANSAEPAGEAAQSGNPILDVMRSSAPQAAQESASFASTAASIVLHLLIAVVLSAVLAFRPRKNFPLFKRNLYVAQTQILLASVAAALMMIVGDNAARAFAIFAAVSLVRFRTNIRDPKEVTVLLISLALGLAAGVGRWDLGVALCGFSLVLLYVLEYNEQEQAIRSMELTVKTKDTEGTQDILRKLFKKNRLDAEVRQLTQNNGDGSVGSIQYYLNLRLSVSTDQLSDKILEVDQNVESIQWAKTKSATDIYQ